MRAKHLTVVECWLRLDLDIDNALYDELRRANPQVAISSHAGFHARTNVPLRTSEPALGCYPYLFTALLPCLTKCKQFKLIKALLIGHEIQRPLVFVSREA